MKLGSYVKPLPRNTKDKTKYSSVLEYDFAIFSNRINE
jgi:hypothetical protein